MNKIITNINVFGTDMKNRVFSEVHGRLIVNENGCGRVCRNAKLRREFSKPDCFTSYLSKGHIFGLYD